MKIPRPHSSSLTGFSLLKLLVTISLIAILSVLIMGSTRGLVAQAKNARCIANLRQMGVYMNIYLVEHNHRMWRDASNQNYSMNDGGWLLALRQVAGIPTNLPATGAAAEGGEFRLFVCPADPTRGGWAEYGALHGIPSDADPSRVGIKSRSYLPNRFILNQDVRGFASPPEQVIAFADFPWSNLGTRAIYGNGDNWINNHATWHGDNVNCLMMDLSVRSLPVSSLKPGGSNYSRWNPHHPGAWKAY